MAIYKVIYCEICLKNCYYKFVPLYPEGIDHYICMECFNKISVKDFNKLLNKKGDNL